MTLRPQLKASVEPIVVSGDGLFLLSEGGHAWMPTPVYAALAPMLDGTHTIEEIFAAFSDIYPIKQVFGALDRLRKGRISRRGCSPI